MKNLTFSFILLLAFLSSAKAQKITLKQFWESDTTVRTPESVIVDPKTNLLYISCINGQPSLENNNSFIAQMDENGKVLKLKFTEGLNSTKGMGIHGDKLYITEMTNVVEISLSTGEILKRYPIAGAKFLNDIAVDHRTGVVYISDSGTAEIWSLKSGTLSLLTKGEPLSGGLNGLLVENNQLLIGNGDGTLYSYNPASKKFSKIAKVSGGIDGIVALGGKKYIVSEWGGKVWGIAANGTTELLIDTTKDKINSADIDYNAKTKVLYIPTFFHNTVRAYSVR